jgi:hypothetical protein
MIGDDDDPFFYYDESGRKLDDETIRRRSIFRVLEKMTPEEFRAHLIKIGSLNPDGSLPEQYRDNGVPSKHRPTD